MQLVDQYGNRKIEKGAEIVGWAEARSPTNGALTIINRWASLGNCSTTAPALSYYSTSMYISCVGLLPPILGHMRSVQPTRLLRDSASPTGDAAPPRRMREDVKRDGGGLLRPTIMVALLLVLVACGADTERETMRFGGSTMGTSYSIALVAPPVGLAQQAVAAQVQAILDGVDAEMSSYRRDSSLSQFNRYRADDWFPVSARMLGLVEQARKVSEMTGGAFDITVGGLVDLWGFGPQLGAAAIPAADDLATQRARVGFSRLQTRAEPPALRKTLPGLEIDLSAIAKGYAVDRVADWLAGQGVNNYLVEVGGELRVAGSNPAGKPWRVAVERPQNDARQVMSVLKVSDTGIATSGDYRNYFEVDGRRYSHAIDPATGEPVHHQLVSVTVVSPQAALADALATGLLVLGPQAGYRVAKSEGLAVLFIERHGDRFKSRWTPALLLAVQGAEGLEQDQ